MTIQTDKLCPVCGAELYWKISGKGKHLIGKCPKHGFVAMVAHPLMPGKRGFLYRLRRAWNELLGR